MGLSGYTPEAYQNKVVGSSSALSIGRDACPLQIQTVVPFSLSCPIKALALLKLLSEGFLSVRSSTRLWSPEGEKDGLTKEVKATASSGSYSL